MSKKRIGIVITLAVVLGLGFLLYQQIIPGEYVPADDEIALHIQLNTKEDIGLLGFDYRAAGTNLLLMLALPRMQLKRG